MIRNRDQRDAPAALTRLNSTFKRSYGIYFGIECGSSTRLAEFISLIQKHTNPPVASSVVFSFIYSCWGTETCFHLVCANIQSFFKSFFLCCQVGCQTFLEDSDYYWWMHCLEMHFVINVLHCQYYTRQRVSQWTCYCRITTYNPINRTLFMGYFSLYNVKECLLFFRNHRVKMTNYYGNVLLLPGPSVSRLWDGCHRYCNPVS